jgi:hypothetical protein
VDEATLLFKRCDVARVKVVSKEVNIIDSFMAVKVNGEQFDIRVIEELGGVYGGGNGGWKVDPGWQEDQSSKASEGAVSNFAVAEGGVSESGSDADVSESCQVLLEIQTHGGARQTTYDTTKKLRNTEEEVAGVIPNLLGNSLMCLVNHERDNSEGLLMETDGVGQVLGNEHTVCLGGVNGMEDSGQRSGDAVGQFCLLLAQPVLWWAPRTRWKRCLWKMLLRRG